MPRISQNTRAELLSKPNVHAVWTSRKTGKVNVGVTRKVPLVGLAANEVIPREVETEDGEPLQTDVIEMGPIYAREFTQERRPCPGGFSVGHHRITAGTLGIWVVKDGKKQILSNNHVLADSNEATIGDRIVQPGPVDNDKVTTDPSTWIGRLSEFVRINTEGGDGGLPDLPPGCTGQFLQGFSGKPDQSNPREIEQPYPNLVDAALAEEFGAGYAPEIHKLGRPSKMRDAVVGENVTKAGRTTEVTVGWVEADDLSVQVQYGGFVALFDQQLMIFSDGGPFSQGGDSGSAILSEDLTYLVGLLFAGGEMSDGTDVTIGNRISHVRDLLGFTL